MKPTDKWWIFIIIFWIECGQLFSFQPNISKCKSHFLLESWFYKKKQKNKKKFSGGWFVVNVWLNFFNTQITSKLKY